MILIPGCRIISLARKTSLLKFTVFAMASATDDEMFVAVVSFPHSAVFLPTFEWLGKKYHYFSKSSKFEYSGALTI